MKILSFLLGVVLMLNAGGCRAHSTPWKQVDVYLVGWDMLTRTSLTPDRACACADSKHSYRADAYKVIDALDLGALRPTKDTHPEDARLVVDLFNAAGQRTTYYASRFNLCTVDNAQKHPVSESFHHRFQALAK